MNCQVFEPFELVVEEGVPLSVFSCAVASDVYEVYSLSATAWFWAGVWIGVTSSTTFTDPVMPGCIRHAKLMVVPAATFICTKNDEVPLLGVNPEFTSA